MCKPSAGQLFKSVFLLRRYQGLALPSASDRIKAVT
jgi:hypothetical protein